MFRKARFFIFAIWSLAPPVFAQPVLSVTPGGLQSGNWVWDIAITPDLVLAGEGTPVAEEIGFRLIGSPLLSATNINPTEFDTPNTGTQIFGWETPGSGTNGQPQGLQVNLATNEIFTAFGSIDFPTGGPKPFLQIIASGPGNGGTDFSTIQWLGAYGGKRRIAQLTIGQAASAEFRPLRRDCDAIRP
jgi:hypothetical protein